MGPRGADYVCTHVQCGGGGLKETVGQSLGTEGLWHGPGAGGATGGSGCRSRSEAGCRAGWKRGWEAGTLASGSRWEQWVHVHLRPTCAE